MMHTYSDIVWERPGSDGLTQITIDAVYDAGTAGGLAVMKPWGLTMGITDDRDIRTATTFDAQQTADLAVLFAHAVRWLRGGPSM